MDRTDHTNETIALSAVLVARDAAATLPAALASVRFCDEIIVVVDAASTDSTESIAHASAGRVVVRPWGGFGPTKRFAAGLARGQWVLSIDADETVSPELAAAIRAVISDTARSVHAYAFRRRTRFLGRWMRHGDWGRDRVVRLFRRGAADFSDAAIHESIQAPGRKPLLDGWLWHEGDATLESYLARQNLYTTLAAQAMFAAGRRASWWSLLVVPGLRFIRSYLLRLGFLDGWEGLVLARYSSVYVFTRHAKLRCLWRLAGRQ